MWVGRGLGTWESADDFLALLAWKGQACVLLTGAMFACSFTEAAVGVVLSWPVGVHGAWVE